MKRQIAFLLNSNFHSINNAITALVGFGVLQKKERGVYTVLPFDKVDIKSSDVELTLSWLHYGVD